MNNKLVAGLALIACVSVGILIYSWQKVQVEPLPEQLPDSALCNSLPTGIDYTGRDIYPIDPKYADLDFLGQIFTAYSCGPERVSGIFGVDGKNYTLGSAIWLKSNPSESLIAAFKSVGFKCGQEVSELNCKKWELWDPVKVDDLMKLEPYHENFEADDCRNCG